MFFKKALKYALVFGIGAVAGAIVNIMTEEHKFMCNCCPKHSADEDSEEIFDEDVAADMDKPGDDDIVVMEG